MTIKHEHVEGFLFGISLFSWCILLFHHLDNNHAGFITTAIFPLVFATLIHVNYNY